MKEQAAFKPTQAEMTFLLKEILMGKLTSFPTIEMGIYYKTHRGITGPLLIWRSVDLRIVSAALSNASGMAAKKIKKSTSWWSH